MEAGASASPRGAAATDDGGESRSEAERGVDRDHGSAARVDGVDDLRVVDALDVGAAPRGRTCVGVATGDAPRARGHHGVNATAGLKVRPPAPNQSHERPVLARWTDLTTLRGGPLVQGQDDRALELELLISVQCCLLDEFNARKILGSLMKRALQDGRTATELIAEREREIGLTNARAILFNNVPSAMFRKILAAGEVFEDLGASVEHGGLSHRAQWYVASFELEPADLLTAYRASADSHWRRKVGDDYRFAWDEIVDVPSDERGDARCTNPENVRDLLLSLRLPEQESFNKALSREVIDAVPTEEDLPQELRDAPRGFKAWAKPVGVTDPMILGEIFMEERKLFDRRVRAGRFETPVGACSTDS